MNLNRVGFINDRLPLIKKRRLSRYSKSEHNLTLFDNNNNNNLILFNNNNNLTFNDISSIKDKVRSKVYNPNYFLSSTKDKIIYLDIDGVLNCETAYKNGECKYVKHNDLPDNEKCRIKNYHQSFYSKSKYWLNKLIKETGAKIVISSSWKGSGIEWLREVWKHEEMEGEIIDVTPSFISKKLGKESYTIPRGCEIDYHIRNVVGLYHINWCKNEQQKYIDGSGVDNYIIIDDDSDMLYGQKNHFLPVLPSPRNKDGFGEEHYKLGKEMLSKTIIDLNY